MSDRISFPAAGLEHLIIEEMAPDAQVYGAPDSDAIEVNYQASGGRADAPQLSVEDGQARIRDVLVIQAVIPSHLQATVKHAPGDLWVQQLAGDIYLESVQGDLRLAQLEGVAHVAHVDGSIRAEKVADLHLLGRCNGDLRIEQGGRFSAEAVAGDVRLRDVAEARLERVRGDLWAEKVSGSLQVSRADGDARLSEITGPVVIGSVAGDFRADALTAGLTAQRVSGDATLAGPFDGAEVGYALSAEADIRLHLPADADVRLTVHAGGRIRSDVQLTPASDGSPTFSATLGRGTHRIVLNSGSDLRIVHHGEAATQSGKTRRTSAAAADARPGVDVDELSGLGERIRQQVNASLAAAGISVPPGEASWGRRGRGGVAGSRGARPPGPERQQSGVSAPAASLEEQTAVLQMLAEGKISAEEADVLLKALGA